MRPSVKWTFIRFLLTRIYFLMKLCLFKNTKSNIVSYSQTNRSNQRLFLFINNNKKNGKLNKDFQIWLLRFAFVSLEFSLTYVFWYFSWDIVSSSKTRTHTTWKFCICYWLSEEKKYLHFYDKMHFNFIIFYNVSQFLS